MQGGWSSLLFFVAVVESKIIHFENKEIEDRQVRAGVHFRKQPVRKHSILMEPSKN